MLALHLVVYHLALCTERDHSMRFRAHGVDLPPAFSGPRLAVTYELVIAAVALALKDGINLVGQCGRFSSCLWWLNHLRDHCLVLIFLVRRSHQLRLPLVPAPKWLLELGLEFRVDLAGRDGYRALCALASVAARRHAPVPCDVLVALRYPALLEEREERSLWQKERSAQLLLASENLILW